MPQYGVCSELKNVKYESSLGGLDLLAVSVWEVWTSTGISEFSSVLTGNCAVGGEVDYRDCSSHFLG